MEIMKRPNTELWQVIEESQQTQALPTQQVTNIYNVHIEGVAGWMSVLAHMPASTVWAGAACVGVAGAVILSTLMVVATIAMQFIFGLVIAAVVALVALVSISAMVKG